MVVAGVASVVACGFKVAVCALARPMPIVIAHKTANPVFVTAFMACPFKLAGCREKGVTMNPRVRPFKQKLRWRCGDWRRVGGGEDRTGGIRRRQVRRRLARSDPDALRD